MTRSVRRLVLVAVLVLLGNGSSLEAAPVILHFEAVVAEVDGSLASSPLDIEIGDKITGEYVFQEADFVDSQTGALGANAFELNGVVLESNNAGLALNTGVLIPVSLLLDPPPSTLLIQCHSPTDVFPGCNSNRFPGNENFIWEPTLTLFAAPDALETLADVRSLSSLANVEAIGTFRMVISELDTMQGTLQPVLTIRAEITSLVVVPEPSVLVLCVIAIVIAVAKYRLPI